MTQSTEFTRIILPDGNGKTVSGQLGWAVGQTIHQGDIAEWPELNGWEVCERHLGYGGRTQRGQWRGGSCLYLLVRTPAKKSLAVQQILAQCSNDLAAPDVDERMVRLCAVDDLVEHCGWSVEQGWLAVNEVQPFDLRKERNK